MPKLGLISKLQNLVASLYLVADPYLVEVLLATVIAHRLKGDPVWIIIVAPSSGAKSEFINLISTVNGVFPISTLTGHTLASGQRVKEGEETSLLMRIGSGIMTFKDFTSLLSEQRDERAVIMAQLREIYDGKYKKSFGTGKDVNWVGKITVLAGSTHVIHSLKAQYTAMGERFLLWNMTQPDRIEAGDRTMQNQESGEMQERRDELTEAARKLIDEDLELPEVLPKITPELRGRILDIAELVTRARSNVDRDWKTGEITEVYDPEMPARMAGQLQGFARALMILSYNEYGKAELLERYEQILYKLGLDNIPHSRMITMIELSRYDTLETTGLATKLGFPTTTVRHWLEDLTALKIAKRDKKGVGNRADTWSILPKYKKIILHYENIELKGGNLSESSILQEEEAGIQKIKDDAMSLLSGIEIETPLEILIPEGL